MNNKSNCCRDSVLENDLTQLATNLSILQELKNSTILVTGSTGLIGSGIVKLLLFANQINDLNLTVLALCRNMLKAESVFHGFLENSNLIIVHHDILKQLDIEEEIDYIIHGASITQSKDFINKPVETINTTMIGTENILKLALNKNAKGVLFLSSLEIYGEINGNTDTITETDYGFIDLLNPRSSYSESKRLAECLCIAYSEQYSLPVKIARLTQTFGPGVDYNDNRVFAQFAKSILENKNIVLHTKGETERNYIYLSDAISAIFYVLLKGQRGEAYNIASPDTSISILKMAELFVNLYPEKELKVVHKLAIPDEKMEYNPTIKIKLDVRKLEQLGWKASVGFPSILKNTVLSMQERYVDNL